VKIFKTICKSNFYEYSSVEKRIYDHLVVGKEYEFEFEYSSEPDLYYAHILNMDVDKNKLTKGYWFIVSLNYNTNNFGDIVEDYRFNNYFYNETEMLKMKLNEIIDGNI